MAVENRVSCNQEESNNERDVCDLDNNTFLPSDIEQKKQKDDYVALIGRVITSHIPCLEFLKEVAVKHIPHKYSDLTSQPTETVS